MDDDAKKIVRRARLRRRIRDVHELRPSSAISDRCDLELFEPSLTLDPLADLLKDGADNGLDDDAPHQ